MQNSENCFPFIAKYLTWIALAELALACRPTATHCNDCAKRVSENPGVRRCRPRPAAAGLELSGVLAIARCCGWSATQPRFIFRPALSIWRSVFRAVFCRSLRPARLSATTFSELLFEMAPQYRINRGTDIKNCFKNI